MILSHLVIINNIIVIKNMISKAPQASSQAELSKQGSGTGLRGVQFQTWPQGGGSDSNPVQGPKVCRGIQKTLESKAPAPRILSRLRMISGCLTATGVPYNLRVVNTLHGGGGGFGHLPQ